MSDIRKLIIMIDEIHRIENRWGFRLGFYGRKVAKSPVWQVYQNPKSVRRVNKGLLSKIHELWILVHIVDAILSRFGGQLNNKYIKVKGYPEEPATTIHGTLYGDITIWYQFRRYGPERHNHLLQMCMQKQFNQVAKILDLNVTPQNCADCYSMVKQGNLIPDIVIVKGYFKRANDIRDSTQTRVTKKAIIVDPKLELTKNDCNQLNSYLSIFSDSIFICPCICPCNEKALNCRPNNWIVITCVEPTFGKGLDDFKKCLIDSIKKL